MTNTELTTIILAGVLFALSAWGAPALATQDAAREYDTQDAAREYDQLVIGPCLLHYAMVHPDWLHIEDPLVLEALARDRLMAAIEADHDFAPRIQADPYFAALPALDRMVALTKKLADCKMVVERLVPTFRTLSDMLPWCGHQRVMRDVVELQLNPYPHPMSRERFGRALEAGQCADDRVPAGTRLGYVEHQTVLVGHHTVTLVKVTFADDAVPVLSDFMIRATRGGQGRFRAPFWTIADYIGAL